MKVKMNWWLTFSSCFVLQIRSQGWGNKPCSKPKNFTGHIWRIAAKHFHILQSLFWWQRLQPRFTESPSQCCCASCHNQIFPCLGPSRLPSSFSRNEPPPPPTPTFSSDDATLQAILSLSNKLEEQTRLTQQQLNEQHEKINMLSKAILTATFRIGKDTLRAASFSSSSSF